MAKSSLKTSRKSGNATTGSVARRSVSVGRDYVTVKYRSYTGNRTIKLSKASIVAGGRAALAQVPVVID